MEENISEVWSSNNTGDIEKLESIPRKFTRFLPSMFNLPCSDRLQHLGLEKIEILRIRVDLVLFYKMIHGIIGTVYNDYFTMNERISIARGHNLYINVKYSRVGCRSTFFCKQDYSFF